MTKKFPNTSTIEMGDRVKIDGKTPGVVVQDAHTRSLVEFAAPPESGISTERDWYDNNRLLVTARRQERLVGDEPKGIKIIK